jgi:hypothetical protein
MNTASEEPHTGPLPFSMMHPAGNKTSVIQIATHVEEFHTGPSPFSMMHPAGQIVSSDEHSRIIVPTTRNSTNGTIPFDPPTPLLFNETGIPGNLTALVPRNRTGLIFRFAPHNQTFGSALPDLNGTTRPVITVQSPPDTSRSGTVLSFVLIALLVTIVFSAFLRSLYKKSNGWSFRKKSQLKVDEEVAGVVEVKGFDNSVV